MNPLLILTIILFSGCTVIPQDARSRARLAEVYPASALSRELTNVGGQDVIISSIGYGFPDDSLVIEVDRLLQLRKKQGVWRVGPELPTANGKWSSVIIEDYLVLTHIAGERPLFATLYVSSSGKVGIRKADAPMLDKLEPLARSIEASLSPRESRTPYVIIPK